MTIDLAKAIPTFVGSVLSCLATLTVLISYVALRRLPQSFRHALILNLAVAEFINSSNNSISGLYILAHRKQLEPNRVCTLNGWVGQWSVQAVDFSILAIAVITLLTITRTAYMPSTSVTTKVLVCVSTWTIPTITSSVAAGLHKIAPVSGNWCWIAPEPSYLRYALGHGWRFAIIIVTLSIYIYIWIFLKRHYKNLRFFVSPHAEGTSLGSSKQQICTGDTFITTPWVPDGEDYPFSRAKANGTALVMNPRVMKADDYPTDRLGLGGPATILVQQGQAITTLKKDSQDSMTSYRLESGEHPTLHAHNVQQTTRSSAHGKFTPGSKRVEREIQLMLFLNAYPLLYIILWVPGILNRIFEATGHPNRALSILQSSTQYVGLANAITYGFDQRLRREVIGRLSVWRNGRRVNRAPSICSA